MDKKRSLYALAGFGLFLCFLGLQETAATLYINFKGPWTNSSSGEVYFWLSHALFLVPGACLLGYGAEPLIWKFLGAAKAKAAEVPQHQHFALFAMVGLIYTALSRGAHALILRDRPFTDDEYAVRFGGQILSMGKATIDIPELYPWMPKVFLLAHEGQLTSFDWLGPQMAWAVAELSGLGSLVFHGFAGAMVFALGYLLYRRLGMAWGMLGVLVMMFSPMIAMLSASTHAHVLSRGALAVAVLCYWLGSKENKSIHWVLTGLAFGVAFLCRLPESVCVGLPFVGAALYDAAKNREGARRALVLMLAGIAFPMACFFVHNALVTGNPLEQSRFLAASARDMDLEKRFLAPNKYWSRFGANLSYNLFMLSIWFLGPLGAISIVAGVTTDRLTKLLGAGLAVHLGIAMLHDDHGLHMVGPIHYSEQAVALVVVGVHGFKNIYDKLTELSFGHRTYVASLLSVVVLSMGVFDFWHGSALRRQASIQEDIYTMIERDAPENSVILAPRFAFVWLPFYEHIGSFVFEWRPPQPDFSDARLILHEDKGIQQAIETHLPDRKVLRLVVDEEKSRLFLETLKP